MKKWLYHPIGKAFAWLLLWVSICACLIGGIMMGHFASMEETSDIRKEEFVDELLQEETERMLKRLNEYYVEYANWYFGKIASIEKINQYEDEFSLEKTNLRFYIEGTTHEYYFGEVFPTLHNDDCYLNPYAKEMYFEIDGQHLKVLYYVDTSYPVEDSFSALATLGEQLYNSSEYRWIILGCGLFGAVLALVYLIRTTGRKCAGGEIADRAIHRIPFEALFIGGGLLACFLFLGWRWFYRNSYGEYTSHLMRSTWAWLFLLLLCSGIACVIVWTLVVRLKSGNHKRTFLVYRLLLGLLKLLERIGHGMLKCGKIFEKVFGHFFLCVVFTFFYAGLCLLELAGILWCDGEMYWQLGLWLGKFVLLTPILYRYVASFQKVNSYTEQMVKGEPEKMPDSTGLIWPIRRHAENLEQLQEGIEIAVQERLKSERMKTELITNVSHDIKTPLTSIINYVDLLKKEELPNEQARGYVEILERQSLRLKKLTEDVIEASKAASGAIAVSLEPTDLGLLLLQVFGEYEERMQKENLSLVTRLPEQIPYVLADASVLWRVLSNLFGNACKYSQGGTRVYFTVKEEETTVLLCMRNISAAELNISGEELMERFVRGDDSRNTEGSGLGLSIAKSLTELQHGEMKIEIDGDLFKVYVALQKA